MKPGEETIAASLSGSGAIRDEQAGGLEHSAVSLRYAYFALFVLTTCNVLSYIDRQIISILATSIQTDLKLDDAQLGFLMGTAFAVFYCVVGIAMGRIADQVHRPRMVAIGLLAWSIMTGLAGAAAGYTSLALTRAGVGVGEAAANPSSVSLLSQYFPPHRRAQALGTLISGAFIGSAIALILGGYMLSEWQEMCRYFPLLDACSIAPWRATYGTVAAPGLILAFIVAMLREPGSKARSSASVGQILMSELGSAIPPLNLFRIRQLGGVQALGRNLLAAAGILGLAWLFAAVTGDALQWGAIGFGAYAICSWIMLLSLRDRDLYAHTIGNPTFRLIMICGALTACPLGAIAAWSAPYGLRELGFETGRAGLTFGLILALGSILGVIAGGAVTDTWKRRDARAPVWMGLIALFGSLPPLVIMITTRSQAVFLAAMFAFNVMGAIWSGGFAAMIQDEVGPSMRGSAAAINAMTSILVASGLGPYSAGKVSMLTGSLATGMLSVYCLVAAIVPLSLVLARRLAIRRLQCARPTTA